MKEHKIYISHMLALCNMYKHYDEFKYDLNEKLYPSLEISHFNPDAKISLGGEPKKYE